MAMAFLGFVLWSSIAATAVTVSATGQLTYLWRAACGSETFAPLVSPAGIRASSRGASGAPGPAPSRVAAAGDWDVFAGSVPAPGNETQ